MSPQPPEPSSDPSLDDGSAPHGVLHGWPQWGQAVARLMDLAARQGAELLAIDSDFSRWPWSQPEVLDAWHRWAVSHRGCQARLLAQDWRAAVRHHGAWLRAITPWGHRVACLQIQPEDLAQWPGTMLVAVGVGGVRLSDDLHAIGVWVDDSRQLREWLRECDVILQRSSSVQPQATLGL